MISTTPPISPPSSPPPTRATPTQNVSVTENSPSPSQSGTCTLSKDDQGIINAHRNGKLSEQKKFKFSDVGILEWQDKMALSHSDKKLSDLTESIGVFAAETKNRKCQNLVLHTKRGCAILKLGDPDMQLHCSRSGYTTTKETSHSSITEELTMEILSCLYDSHETADIEKQNSGNSPLQTPAAGLNWPETKRTLVKELPTEIKRPALDDGSDSDTMSVDGDDDEEKFPPPPTLEEITGEIRRPEDMGDSNAVASQTEDGGKTAVSARSSEGLNGPGFNYLGFELDSEIESAHGPGTIQPRQSAPFNEAVPRNAYLSGIIPVAPEVTKQPQRPDAANDSSFEVYRSSSERRQSDFSSMSSTSRDFPSSPTSSGAPLTSLERSQSQSEKISEAVALAEAEQHTAALIEFDKMVKEFLNGKTTTEATEVLKNGRNELEMMRSEADIKNCTPKYQEKINLFLDRQSNLRSYVSDLINMGSLDKAMHVVLHKKRLEMRGEDKTVGANRILGVPEIKRRIRAFIDENQNEIDARNFRVSNTRPGDIPVNVKGTKEKLEKRIEEEKREQERARSRSPSPTRST